MTARLTYIVLVQDKTHHAERAYGVYRSFKAACADAQAWNGVVIPLEGPDDAVNPEDPHYLPPTNPVPEVREHS